jgi:hypothetical protein
VKKSKVDTIPQITTETAYSNYTKNNDKEPVETSPVSSWNIPNANSPQNPPTK